jgi:hypothetical protein
LQQNLWSAKKALPSPHFSPMMNRRRKRALTTVRIGDCAYNPNG